MEKFSRYRILQFIFVLVFLISVFVIWFLVRNQPRQLVAIEAIFQTRVPTALATLPVTPTVGAVDVDPTETVSAGESAPDQPFTSYVVQSGDTLASIAREFNVTVGILQQANGLGNSELISSQDVLLIPNNTAFSIIGVSATVESLSGTQAAVKAESTAISATSVAHGANISQLATREFSLAGTVEANAIKIDVLADAGEQAVVERVDWVSILTGPILTSLLAFGGFLTSTWFEWRDDQREEESANSDIERKKMELELKLLELQVKEKEQTMRRGRQ